MATFTAAAAQTVAANQNAVLTTSPIPCNRGFICHRPGSGLITLRGITNQCRARYKVSATANIAVATGGTAGAISVALTNNGEALPTATAIVTPGATGALFNVRVEDIFDVPKGCCITLALRNTSAQAITVQNLNIIVERIA